MAQSKFIVSAGVEARVDGGKLEAEAEAKVRTALQVPEMIRFLKNGGLKWLPWVVSVLSFVGAGYVIITVVIRP